MKPSNFFWQWSDQQKELSDKAMTRERAAKLLRCWRALSHAHKMQGVRRIALHTFKVTNNNASALMRVR